MRKRDLNIAGIDEAGVTCPRCGGPAHGLTECGQSGFVVTFDEPAEISKSEAAAILARGGRSGGASASTCENCRWFGSRARKDGPAWDEAYCGHESLAPGAGAMGVPADPVPATPEWCPISSRG